MTASDVLHPVLSTIRWADLTSNAIAKHIAAKQLLTSQQLIDLFVLLDSASSSAIPPWIPAHARNSRSAISAGVIAKPFPNRGSCILLTNPDNEPTRLYHRQRSGVTFKVPLRAKLLSFGTQCVVAADGAEIRGLVCRVEPERTVSGLATFGFRDQLFSSVQPGSIGAIEFNVAEPSTSSDDPGGIELEPDTLYAVLFENMTYSAILVPESPMPFEAEFELKPSDPSEPIEPTSIVVRSVHYSIFGGPVLVAKHTAVQLTIRFAY